MEEELRKQAIQRHLAGESPKSIYTSLHRSNKWFFKWLKRFQSGTTDWYKEHSRAPLTQPSGLSTTEKELITSTRSRLESLPFAQIGVSAIKWELQKLGLKFHSDSTINRTLKREGLVKKKLDIPPKVSSTHILLKPCAATTSIRWILLAPVTSRVVVDSIQ
jgi:transposase